MPGLQFKHSPAQEPKALRECLCFMQLLARNGQFLSAFSPACCQYSSAIGSSHTLTETVFISSFSLRRLERSFHRFCILFFVLKTRAQM